MDIRDYWQLPPTGQGSQDEIMKQSLPPPYKGRCGGIVEITEPRKEPINPCIAVHGNGPDGAICRDCVHCRYSAQYQTRHWKCDLRKLTHGAATDHRVTWPACGRYEKRTKVYHGG